MRIYIFRHGVALDAADPSAPELDADRPLTADGTERTRMALHGLISMGAVVDRIWTSPYVRCVQTAQLAAEVLGVPRMSIEKLTEMEPGGDPASLPGAASLADGAQHPACRGQAVNFVARPCSSVG